MNIEWRLRRLEDMNRIEARIKKLERDRWAGCAVPGCVVVVEQNQTIGAAISKHPQENPDVEPYCLTTGRPLVVIDKNGPHAACFSSQTTR